MNDGAHPGAFHGDLQTTVTVTETSSTSSASTGISRRSSLMHLITEPVTHLRERKRKWASSKHSSSVEELCTSSEVSSDNDNASSSDKPIMSKSRWGTLRRRRSAATDRVVGKIKTMFRKDSHFDNSVLLEKASRVHRDMHLENNIPGAPLIRGPNCCAHVHAYFDVMGEAGPSNFDETAEWRRFHRRQAYLRKLALKNAAFHEQTPARYPQSQPLQIADVAVQQPRSTGMRIAMAHPEISQGVPEEMVHRLSIHEDSLYQLPSESMQPPDQSHGCSPVSPISPMMSRAPATTEFDPDMESFSSEEWGDADITERVEAGDEFLGAAG